MACKFLATYGYMKSNCIQIFILMPRYFCSRLVLVWFYVLLIFCSVLFLIELNISLKIWH